MIRKEVTTKEVASKDFAVPSLSLIVAMADNRAIGINNELPWHISEDLRYFKAVTMGKPIIMGRKTFDSIGKALPGRKNIVVTRQKDWQAAGVDVVSSPGQALTLASLQEDDGSLVDEVFVIGGAELYGHALPLAKTLYVTQVHQNVDGDAFFPEISPEKWREVSRAAGQDCAKVDLAYEFVKFESVT